MCWTRNWSWTLLHFNQLFFIEKSCCNASCLVLDPEWPASSGCKDVETEAQSRYVFWVPAPITWASGGRFEATSSSLIDKFDELRPDTSEGVWTEFPRGHSHKRYSCQMLNFFFFLFLPKAPWYIVVYSSLWVLLVVACGTPPQRGLMSSAMSASRIRTNETLGCLQRSVWT